ncbi:CPBP family intramembrane glutamic endopeptidase [Oligoflexus tunisiensis]|uniref:CPBP family intramembrane glutamic endopeptidase n=1 Tax=Oligoflexus tunisiensis TaxID=708132 RepID=UPI00114C8E3C|nr:CPBP family intramembrane glutamic endopeptidase [Oligoflexus tunisiensis]
MQDQNDAGNESSNIEQMGNFVLSSSVFYVGMAGVGAMVSLYRHHSLKNILTLPAEMPALATLLGLGMLGAAVLLIANYLFEEQFPSFKIFRHVLMQMIGSATVPVALYLAFISAIGEELLFRAAVQPVLGLVGTALLFGLLHLGPQGLISIWTLWAIISGLMLGWLFEATGNLWPPLLCHFLVNAISMLTLRVQYRRFLATHSKQKANKA